MKITKEGEVISCCEWVREIGKSDSLKIDPFDSQGDVTVPWLRIRQLGGWHVILRLHYCPACGEKTEVEESSSTTLRGGDVCPKCGGTLEGGSVNGLVVCSTCGFEWLV